ncbi:hypothetical protein [Sorangium sp. So ce1151]|uniref:hypothetical protein n=1 Tax=Sorangium sp. So ce1151 TaxID=3133332 RepID=UPI003F619A41
MTILSTLRDLSMARPACRAAALAFGLCIVGGCAVEQDPGAEAVEEGLAPITTLRLANDAEVRFYEPEEGLVLTFTTGEVPGAAEELPPVALYEALSGHAAPQVLIDAQARMDQARLARGPRRTSTEADLVEETPPSPQAGAAEGLGVAAQALSATSFQSSFCNTAGVDFDYCWTDSSVSRTTEISSVNWLHAHADAISGAIQMTVSYKNTWGNWIVVFDQTVSAAGGVTLYDTVNNDRYRVTISSVNSGDVYHLAIHGER